MYTKVPVAMDFLGVETLPCYPLSSTRKSVLGNRHHPPQGAMGEGSTETESKKEKQRRKAGLSKEAPANPNDGR